jgi:hypothetical protein
MIVRNNTTDTLHGLEVIGVARDSAGTLVASGASQGFEPALSNPASGRWASSSSTSTR